MTFSYCLTFYCLNESQIVDHIKSMELSGDIYVGNQNPNLDVSYKRIILGEKNIHLYTLCSKGVSLNRNFLLSKVTSDYVMFLDDDVDFIKGKQPYAESIVSSLEKDVVRFNVGSLNANRPIKEIKKTGSITFFNYLKSFGCWGMYFKVSFIKDNKLSFDEKIGPGTEINHGEDSVFNKHVLSKTSVYQLDDICFCAEQNESTWQGMSRNITKELYSHGYIYYLLYGRFAKLYLFIHILKHRKNYCSKTMSLLSAFRIGSQGILKAKKEK